MSYAGVESDREYHRRTEAELARIVPYHEQVKRDREKAAQAEVERLQSARRQLEFHRAKVKELRATIRRLERELGGAE